jgi:GTP-binding protein Era
MGQKVVIVSDKPQTTWHRINCIYTDEQSQIVFTDTPGVHKAVNNVNRYMLKAVGEALEGMDLILWIIDLEKGITRGDDYVFDKIKDIEKPVIVILNKNDLVDEERVEQQRKIIEKKYSINEFMSISAKDKLYRKPMIEKIFDHLKEGGFLYPEDILTDRSNKFLTSEIIREKIFRLTYEEIPYSCAVYVEYFAHSETGKLKIRAEIWVERKTQKGMIIGKGATVIKKIRKSAERDIKYLFDTTVELELYVRVKEDWRKKDYLLNSDLYFS